MSRTIRRTTATIRQRNRPTSARPAAGVVEKLPPAEEQPIVLRLPVPLLSKVDEVVKARPIRIPRHTWLLEAIWEKLEREQA
jgi:hypothetical protein